MAFPSKATHQPPRDNAATLLRASFDHDPISRAEVAHRSDLTRTPAADGGPESWIGRSER